MTAPPTHLVVGPPRHGVVSFATALADSLTQHGYPAPIVRLDDWADLDAALRQRHTAGGIHVNFTDRLFGSTPAEAAERVSALVRRVASAGARVTATLHDVPQPSDGGNHRQRILAYRTVCRTLHGCATNSEHERSLLSESAIADPVDVVVVPLPLELSDYPPERPSVDRPCVAVLGFVYPGKGHPEVLAAMANTPHGVEFLAIGECSAGHDDLADELGECARASGRRFAVTGYVPDDALAAALHRVTVPVIGHRHVSASGSLNTWIAAHRRPLVPVNRYTVEHDVRHPGTVLLYPDSQQGLAEAIESALAEPNSTWLADDAVSGSPPAETARRYAEVLARWHD